MTERPPGGSGRLTPDTWRRVCLVLDRVHDAPAGARDAALEDGCREQGLAVDDVRPFLDAEAQSDVLPEELPSDIIASALGESSADAAQHRLAAGTRLGPYEILEHAGTGGMGQVYRAKDTRLDRIVAVKVLRPHLLASAGARERFDREARAISSLNHPHVCTVHDVGHQDGVDFLVMEHVEGETLAARIGRGGRLPLDQALRFGSQVAAALDAAHRQGIVHRDLKPANIMITRAGVKLLDFGLALVAASKDGPEDRALAGTPEYMAPEQLARRQADARSDIYACGAVLLEMLTGTRARPKAAPAVPGAPPALEWTLAKCLADDPDDRWQSAADVKHHLDWIAAAPAASGQAAPGRAGRSVPWLAAAAMLLALAAIGAWAWTQRRAGRAPSAPAVFAINPPGGTTFELTQALSGDGRRLAFTAARAGGTRELWVRALDALAAQRVAGTEGAAHPFWSPDGRFVAFFADRKLKKVDLASGAVHVICDAEGGAGGAWNDEDVIVFSPASGVTTGLQRVSASGGAVAPVTTPGEGLRIHAWPQFLSGGRRFIYMRAGRPDPGIYAGRLDSDDAHVLVMPLEGTASKAVAAGGLLFYLDQGALVARPFDESRLALTGEPVRVAEDIHAGSPGLAAFDAAPGGVITYRQSAPARPSQLTWFDRAGRALRTLGEPGGYMSAAISLDGRLVLANRRDESGRAAAGSVAVIDAATGAATPLFTNAASPVWSPDSRRVIFTLFVRDGAPTPVVAALDGGAPPRTLAQFGAQSYATDWSRDGRLIAGAALRAETGADVWIAEAGDAAADDGEAAVRYLAREPFHQHEPRMSPDGRWVAYTGGDARGAVEVYVRSLRDGAGLRRVSTRGGRSPRWRADGRELYYVEPDGGLMRVRVGASEAFSPGPPERLFTHPGLAGEPQAAFAGFAYDIAPGASRFLIAVPASGPMPPPPAIVMVNWALPGPR